MWFQIGNIALGVWLLVAPGVLPSTEPGAVIARIAGPIAIWLGVLAARTVTRTVRALNVLNGMFLAIAPWLVPNSEALLQASVLAGWAIIVLSIPRGALRQRTGGGWWTVFHPEMITHVPEE